MQAKVRGNGWRGPTGATRVRGALLVVAILVLAPTVAWMSGASLGGHAQAKEGSPELSPQWEKPVDFIESGLPSGTVWSVTLAGTLQSSSTDTIAFSEIPGTYPFNVTPVPGYVASPSSGNVTVTSCMGATVYITFTPVVVPTEYTVSFTETGLPPGTSWWVDFAGNNTTATTASINFSALNGTYTFTDAGVIAGATGVQFVTPVTNGTVTVDGSNVSETIPYSTQYYLTTAAIPPTGGTVTPSSGWYAAGASVTLSATNATGYVFLNWSGVGNGNYSGTNPQPTITMNGPIFENASFGYLYQVQFQEIGLADGVTWSVTFNGVTESAYYVFLDFSAPNGTYGFAVQPIPGYHADLYAGHVTVAGSNVTVVISWVRVTYNVTFVESGLPTGYTWLVTLNGTMNSSGGPRIGFLEPNGTYPFEVAPVSGYTANVTSGTVTVNGANVTVEIGWTAVEHVVATFTISFVETGLPAGTTWSVTVNGTTSVSQSSSTTTILFTSLPNGTYPYWVPNVGTYLPTPAMGSAAVNGANVTVTVAFATTPVQTLHTTSSQAISIWDLLILAFIAGGCLVCTYLIFRRR